MYIRLIRSIFQRPPERPGRRRPYGSGFTLGLLAAGLLLGSIYAAAPADAAPNGIASMESVATDPTLASSADLEELEGRVARLRDAWADASDYYRAEVAPIRRVLLRYRGDPELAEHVAVALVREANRVEVEPRLLLAVLLVENPWLDPDIRSSVGAVGLMQVMPVHRGGWPTCGDDLEDVDSNICHGAHIFAHYFERSGGNIERALLRYNGCVRGTNTPNCQQYPYHVFARAGRASVQAWLDTPPAASSR